LYTFWGDAVTKALNKLAAERQSAALINLASDEYFKVVKPRLLDVPLVTPVFEDWKNGKYKVISFYAKRARGLMARYAALKNVSTPAKLKAFDSEGYVFHPESSNDNNWIFRRRVSD